jgi:cell fate regulator YaaT (PSP1 superfamily)
MNPFVVGIRFQKVGKVYHFDASAHQDIQGGDFVVVETTRGRQLGEVVQILDDPAPPPEGTWKPILRKATPRDLVLRQTWQQKEIEAMIDCRAKASEIKLQGIKIVAAEFSFDGARLSFLYSTESGDKLDLKALRKVMQRMYPQTQVEMHQIGPRDVAKILGGMGACGLANRCCSKFLTDFSPISIKMAKDQGISLTPSEITGMCGRLRCCLVYEYEQYVEARKQLPKRGKRVMTPMGEGKVVDVFPLKDSVMVLVEEKGVLEFLKHELQPWDELEALRQKSQAPCDRHEGGGCDCGKAANGKAPAQSDRPVEQETGDSVQTGHPEPEDDNLMVDEIFEGLSVPEKPSLPQAEYRKNRGKPGGRKSPSGKKSRREHSQAKPDAGDKPETPHQGAGKRRPPKQGKKSHS